ncbi:hypothetical protein M8J75_014676 [Diaphorina citri]|nr:hypothetical protein M8J75_014676 [Diaphorina citri]
MFDVCVCKRPHGGRCNEMVGKITQLFGWRQTYEVQRLHQLNEIDVISHSKPSGDTWVAVHSLQSQSDGGILDPDDKLSDVADDREQIIANFEDGDGPHHHAGGDGASGSSVGTGSPDIFQLQDGKYRTDIEVTNEQIASGVPVSLHVRRGSEPALNLPNGISNGHIVGPPPIPDVNQSKRWSAAAPSLDDQPPLLRKNELKPSSNGYSSGKWGRYPDEEDELPLRPHTFSREGSNRLSMQFLGESPGGFRYMEAMERLNTLPGKSGPMVNGHHKTSFSLPRENKRKEPLGQANSNPPSCSATSPSTHCTDSKSYAKSEFVVLPLDHRSLGLHVVPDYDPLGKERGLLITGIEDGSPAAKNGRLALFDRIVEINGRQLIDLPEDKMKEIFSNSLKGHELRLQIVKYLHEPNFRRPFSTTQPPQPVFPHNKENNAGVMVAGEERNSGFSKIATVSPTKKISAAGTSTTATLMAANTRKIGKKYEIELTKGSFGLGFKITTRDNPAGGYCPIYVKNILPKGAAVEDGRLKPGDRLLCVNNIDLTGRSQPEVAELLRNTPMGSKVTIVVSRQEVVEDVRSASPRNMEVDSLNQSLDLNSSGSGLSGICAGSDIASSSPLNKSIGESKLDESLVFPWKQKEILQFDIPVHDTEKAGLGVSVKGKTTANTSGGSNGGALNSSASTDLGIFIKSVINGGAASRDGRLRTNDQLLSVNGISLLGKSNTSAMETLRRAMLQSDGPCPGIISITVARKVPSPPPSRHARQNSSSSLLAESSNKTKNSSKDSLNTPDNSGTSENSDNTVIFLPYNNKNTESTSGRNPVIERLTGNVASPPYGVLTGNSASPPYGLRNESYYKATHQQTMLIMNNSGLDSNLTSPTVNQSAAEMVIIEEDPPPNPPGQMKSGANNETPEPKTPTLPVNINPRGSTSSTATVTDATYASQLSLDDQSAGFSRDAFGRQSMSEKRHATLDAKSTDTYQRTKKAREEREKQISEGALLRGISAESIPFSDHNESLQKHQLGPSLGMKKSSSLESLQTMVQEIQMAEDNATYRNAQGVIRVIRGRGCNESFRAAVDRSYDAPLSLNEIRMDTLAEDEGEPGHFGPRQSSLHSTLDAKLVKAQQAHKKKTGLLKGIGWNMFRFGKHRKPVEMSAPASHLGITMRDSNIEEADESEKEAARKAMREEQERLQEKYRVHAQRHNDLQQLAQTHREVSREPSSDLNGNNRSDNTNLNGRLNDSKNRSDANRLNDSKNRPENSSMNGRHNESQSGHHSNGHHNHSGNNHNHSGNNHSGSSHHSSNNHQTHSTHSNEKKSDNGGAPELPERPDNLNKSREQRDNHHHQQQQFGSRDREGSYSSTNSNSEGHASRTERIQQLRAQHQRRHMERRGTSALLY